MDDFVIYDVSVGGGTLALSPMPGRTGQYATDWQCVSDWQPDLVLSMTKQAEMDSKGAGTFGTDLMRAGVDWLHLPVADFGVPVSLDWGTVSDTASSVLASNGRVLVHCFGGCGRSGMMALRLMIAAGEDPDVALARLRGVRPCAVETDDQMAWARRG